MNNKLIASIVVSAIVFGGGGYYFGTKSGASQIPQRSAGAFAGRTGGVTGARFGGGGTVFGNIISKDASSITIQLAAGTSTASGSKIVLFDASTQVQKMVSGSPNDLTVGTNVTAIGTANSDGSITAQSIQIRPAGMGPRGAGN